jgi:hypothetical protein
MITEVERIYLENLKFFEKIKSFANSPPPPSFFLVRAFNFFLDNTHLCDHILKVLSVKRPKCEHTNVKSFHIYR